MVDLLDRHHQRVAGGEGRDGEEGHDGVVALHEAAGELAGDDAAEERRHGPMIVECRPWRCPDGPTLRRRPRPGTRRCRPASLSPTRSTRPHGEDRIFTVPNVITLVRLACLPVFLWLLFGQDDRAAAAWLLGGARRHRLGRRLHRPPLPPGVRRSGKVLDPVADRLLFFVGVVVHHHRRRRPRSGSASLVLVREVLGRRRHPGPGRPGRPAHRRHLVRQGRHLLPDVRLPAVPGRSPAPCGGPTRRGSRRGCAASPAWCSPTTPRSLYVPLGRRALREGRADRAAPTSTAEAGDRPPSPHRPQPSVGSTAPDEPIERRTR